MLSRLTRCGYVACLAVVSGFTSLADCAAAPPVVTSLSVRGLSTSRETTITVTGRGLLPSPNLLLSTAIESQILREGATPQKAVFDVTLSSATPPGIHQLWLANAAGISMPVAISVDSLPELPFADSIAELPAALNGVISGNEIARTSFKGRAGQRVVIEVEARRLGGMLNPVLHLYDARNVQLEWAQAKDAIHGDARIVATLREDGEHVIELHDLLYRAPKGSFFRLKVGELDFADLTYPLAVSRGGQTRLEFVSTSFADGTSVLFSSAGADDQAAVPWPAAAAASGASPRVMTSDLPEFVESADMGPLAAPSAVSGRLAAEREEDRYTFQVTPGERLRFELWANRLGSPVDGVMTVSDGQDKLLATSDDQPRTSDPAVELVMPDGGAANAAAPRRAKSKNKAKAMSAATTGPVSNVVVRVKDLTDRGGHDFVYRLAVTRVSQPDFSLTVDAPRVQVPKSGNTVVRVAANRTNYAGPILLSLVGLPNGVRVTGDEIPAGAASTLLGLTSDGPPSASVLGIVGTAADASLGLSRYASASATAAADYRPWLARELGTVTTDPTPIGVSWDVTSAAKLPLGSSVVVNATLARGMQAGKVRLSLVTSQAKLTKTVAGDVQNGRRVGAEKTIEDTERMLRLEKEIVLEPSETHARLAVIVPGDLAAIPYDVALRADLLADDGKTVLATAYTGVSRLSTMAPFDIQLLADTVDAKAGLGSTGKIAGRIRRIEGFDRPVTITLAGLPPELPVPFVAVAADADEFELPVSFPYQTALRPLSGVRVVGSSRASESIEVLAGDAPVKINVVRGEEPPPLLGVFEDDPRFVSYINEGPGTAGVESGDRYSGTNAIRVDNLKSRAKVPGLGIRIAEKPGPGEYRFIRFAWKKTTGSTLVFELVARGLTAGPRGAPKRAVAYEAGSGSNRFRIISTRLAEQLPTEWTVVTRDLFADFGAFTWDGVNFAPNTDGVGLFDHVYLAKSLEDFEACPPPLAGEPPLAIFEDEPSFVEQLTEGDGEAALFSEDAYSGAASVKVTREQKYRSALPGMNLKIRERPAAGEYRYLQFAWKKAGGRTICVQLNHDGAFGPAGSSEASFRYDTGPREDRSYGAAIKLADDLPAEWTLVTRDLFADFGECVLQGIALSPQDGQYGLFDHMYLGRTLRDFDLAPKKR